MARDKSKYPKTLKEALKSKLTKSEQLVLVSSFDRLGELAIVEIPEELVKKEKLIGETLLGMHKNIRTVAKKVGIHYGRYRRQKLKILAGKRTKTAEYKENGVRMLVNYEDAYFSPRLGNDRLRVSKLVKKGEVVLVMFSGVAPYCLNIRKLSGAGPIYGVEINPKGHALGEKNVKLNKMKDIHLYCGDVRKVVPGLKKKFDRVFMPLPKTSFDFLDVALGVCKKGSIIHYYAFWHQDEFLDEKKRLLAEVKRLGYKARCKSVVKCGDHKPRVYRVCAELVVQ